MLPTVTSTLLLEGLKDSGNQTVWRDYVDRYQPLVVRFAGRLGLRGPDAEDVAQQALLEFATNYRDGKYDRDKGRLRAWLFGIAHRSVRNWYRRHKRREVQVVDSGDGTEFFQAIADDEDALEAVWEDEWRQAVMRECMAVVREELEEKTIAAFDRFAKQGRPARDVAAELGMTENAVFGAKRRVLQRIRELLPRVQEVW